MNRGETRPRLFSPQGEGPEAMDPELVNPGSSPEETESGPDGCHPDHDHEKTADLMTNMAACGGF